LKDGKYRIETTLYRLVIDPAKGGVITNLKEKSSLQEITRERHERGFNEIRGYFYREQEYLSSKNVPATIDVLEDGPLRVKLLIKGRIGEHSFSQVITISESSPVIDFDLTIDWKVNTGIGKYDEGEKFKWENPQKAFYDDAYKLMVCFPLNISSRTVSKDAPFDVTKSKLTNTIYTRWDSIKNNILLHWIDVADTVSTAGLALFTDHTTSYTLMDDSMLGLTLQYSGTGLWGRDYKIDRPSHVKYALVPHAGTWESSNIQAFSANWNEPLLTSISNEAPSTWRRSWISTNQIHWEVSAIRVIENEVLLRIFNTSAADQSGTVVLDDIIQHATLIELNGDEKEELSITTNGRKSELDLSLPRFGIRTVKIRR
jgi:alpha-mannosidase